MEPDINDQNNTSTNIPVVEPVQTPIEVVTAASPTTETPAVQPIQTTAKKPKKHFFIIIGSIFMLLVAGGVALWLFVFNSTPLKEYDGGDYTLMVPKSFEKQTSSVSDALDQVTFSKPNIPTGDNRSYLAFSYRKYNDGQSKEDVISQMDETYFNDSTPVYKDSDTMLNTKIKKGSRNDMVTRVVTADVKKDGVVIAKINLTFYFTNKAGFAITAVTLNEDADIAASLDKIIGSFKEK